MKNKTIALWITFIGGPLGLHRLYLLGRFDGIGRALPIPTLLGLYGLHRVRQYGLDDPWIWLLIPLLGLTVAGCALNALVYGLMATENWNRRFNPGHPSDTSSGETGWVTVAGLVAALLFGTTALMASLAFGFQRYFEYQIDKAPQTIHATPAKKSAD